MRAIASISLTVVAVLTMLATVGVSSASAVELCKAAEEECAEKNVYAENTVIQSTATEPALETSLGSVVCEKSAVSVETSAEAGSPLPGTITALSFSKCKTGGTECTVTPLNLVYYALIEQTKGEEGTLGITENGSGKPSMTVKCGATISCTLGATELLLDFKGGNPGSITAKAEALTSEGGAKCPEKPSSLTATYKFTSPEQVQMGDRTTTLCTVAPNAMGVCTAAYNGGMVESELVGGVQAEFISTLGPTGTVSCEEAPLNGENFLANGTAGSITVMTFEGPGTCTSSLTGMPGVFVTMETPPFARSSFRFRTAARALLVPGGNAPILKFKIELPTAQVCKYRTVKGSWTIFAYMPMKLKSTWQGAVLAGAGAACPELLTLKSESIMTRPGGANLWVTK